MAYNCPKDAIRRRAVVGRRYSLASGVRLGLPITDFISPIVIRQEGCSFGVTEVESGRTNLQSPVIQHKWRMSISSASSPFAKRATYEEGMNV